MSSRSVATTFRGMSCIDQGSFGFVHGPSPAVGEVRISGRTSAQIGSEQSIRVDQSLFVGIITNIEYDYEEDSTHVRMVDWRDRMKDDLMFFAYNMQEDTGLWYHIEPEDWETQKKTYVGVENLRIETFDSISNGIDPVDLFTESFKTSLDILEYIAEQYDIKLSLDNRIKRKLASTIPDNIDANGGTPIIEVVSMVIEKSGCQFSCYGRNILHITMRGVAAAGVENFIRATIANPCLTGARNASIGQELNENSRRVRVIGDRNQYEWVFPCAADWNQNWTWNFAFGGAEMGLLKKALQMTGNEFVSQLPQKYHDESYWPTDGFNNRDRFFVPAEKTRNEMTIQEYADKIVYRCYRVDPRFSIGNMKPNAVTMEDFSKVRIRRFDRDAMNLTGEGITDENGNALPPSQQGFSFQSYPRTWVTEDGNRMQDPDAFGFPHQLSSSLVTNTQLQFTCYASARNIPEGWNNPFARQRMLVPFDSGVALQIEQRPYISNGKMEKRSIIRLLFNEVQPYVRQDAGLNAKDYFQPDYVVVRLAFDREIYQYLYGELGLNIRVRERKLPVRNLFKGFVNGVERPTVRETKNHKGELESSLVKADQFARTIAKNATSTTPITTSGSARFYDRAGITPDGIIDSVSVTFGETGIVETINYSNARNISEDFIGPSKIRVQSDEVFRSELVRDSLDSISRRAMRDKDAIARVSVIAANALWQAGAFIGSVAKDKIYGNNGMVHASISKANLDLIEQIDARSIVPANKNITSGITAVNEPETKVN